MALYRIHQLANVQRDLARKENELSRLRRAGLIISSSPRLEDTLRAVLQMAMEITDGKYGIFRLLDASGKFLVTKAIAGTDLGHPYVEALPVEEPSISAWVAKNRQPARISDLAVEQPWSSIYIPLDAELQMRSELAVPLISPSGRLEGVINLESPLPNAFDDEDRHMLQSLAMQAMVAIQEARLLDALQEIAQLLLTQPEPVVLRRLVNAASELLNARVSSIWLLDGQELVLEAVTGEGGLGERVPTDGSLPGMVVAGRAAVSLDRTLARAFAWQPELRGVDLPSRVWAHPLVTPPGNQPVGAFCVYGLSDSSGQSGGTEWENKILSCLTHYASLAVYNARHQQVLQEAQEQRAVAEMFAAVGDIATNLLHQLNNKIGTIPVRIQGIQDKCETDLERNRYLANNLAEIERSATEAMEAVRRNLIHLHPVRPVPVNLAALLKQALAAARLSEGVVVRFQGLDNLPPVAAAQQNLALVFTNLLENADHAMRGKGRILVSGSHRAGWVEVGVTDTGPGIPPENHARIFDLNFSSGTQPGKLGFGLWWVKTQIVRLGGSVTVESDGQHGTSFRIRLPASNGGIG
jgi:nitrogen-specific signal transduction histidine kinase/putative methionine-R-sulfoxide reductase with GAF domain